MNIVWWVIIGIALGGLSKVFLANRHHQGDLIVMILIAIVGAFLGGFLGCLITGSALTIFSLWSAVLAAVGAVILLWIYVHSIEPKSVDPR